MTRELGAADSRAACPCCGLRTLDPRGEYEICAVCWWEDDGQDNDEADSVSGGANAHLSLTQARVNVLQHGISNPSRVDLVKMRKPVEQFVRDREFSMSADGSAVLESGTLWQSRAFTADGPRGRRTRG